MKHLPHRPIGVFDSGVGGLTVLRELQRLLPGEDFLYVGDSANCPFGNLTEEELTAITGRIFAWFAGRSVKLAVAACNTTSALIDHAVPDCGFEIVSIIAPVARQAAARGFSEIGVVGTEFTVDSGCYHRLIRRENPNIAVYGQGSRNLARLVDEGKLAHPDTRAEVELVMNALLGQHPLAQVILACTHYPIVWELFRQAAPGVEFLDPALAQAKVVRDTLEAEGLRNSSPRGSTEIYTTGDPALFRAMVDRLGIRDVKTLSRLEL